MADRKRSQDGTRETEKFTDDAPTPGQQGRFQGNLERKVGTRDAVRRVEQGEDATTRVRKPDEKDAE
jgi:hypothetical protein